MLTKYVMGVGVLSLVMGLSTINVFATKSDKTSKKDIVTAAFEKWIKGTGGPFDLLDENVHWTIVGSSPYSQTYNSKKEFMDKVITPFNKRFSEKFRPIDIRGIYEDGDQVIAHFIGRGVANDGIPYQNSYAWFLKFQGGKIKEVTAFFDTRLFDEMWNRVKVE